MLTACANTAKKLQFGIKVIKQFVLVNLYHCSKAFQRPEENK